MKKQKVFPLAIIIVTVLFIILSTCSTYILAFLANKQNLISKIGDVHDWISFAGSILGGSITMIALFFTIFQERKDIAESKKNSIRPMLFCEITNKKKDVLILPNCINDLDYIKWRITNASNNIADKVRIVEEISYIYNSNSQERIESCQLQEQVGICIYTVIIEDHYSLQPQAKQLMKTNFILETDENGIFKCGDAFHFKHVIILEYTDYLGEYTYKSKFEFDLNINIDIENNPHIFLSSTSNKLLDP